MANTRELNAEQQQELAKRLNEGAKGFKLILSTKDVVLVDESEIQRVMEGIQNGGIIKLKQGLVNPSYIVTLVEDEDRVKKFREEVSSVLHNNLQSLQYEWNQTKDFPTFKPLKDVLAGVQLKMLPKGSDIKSIENKG